MQWIWSTKASHCQYVTVHLYGQHAIKRSSETTMAATRYVPKKRAIFSYKRDRHKLASAPEYQHEGFRHDDIASQ